MKESKNVDEQLDLVKEQKRPKNILTRITIVVGTLGKIPGEDTGEIGIRERQQFS